MSGMVRAERGARIRYGGPEISGLKPHKLVARGLCHAPEGRGIFPNLTVAENLGLGAYLRRDEDGIAADLEKVFALFPRLRERATQMAGTLSGGEQQMLAIARALMARPKLLAARRAVARPRADRSWRRSSTSSRRSTSRG